MANAPQNTGLDRGIAAPTAKGPVKTPKITGISRDSRPTDLGWSEDVSAKVERDAKNYRR